MKRAFALLMLAILLAAPASCGKKAFKYVTADTLICRQEPRVGAPVVTVLPYGTKVQVSRADRDDTVGNQKGKWFYSDALGGYLFGAFLSDAPPPAGKFSMTLVMGGLKFDLWRERYCAMPGMGGSETSEKITLAGNRAVLERTTRFEASYTKTIESGTYEAVGPRIEIELTHREKTALTGPALPARAPLLTREEIRESVTLIYSEKAAGFVVKDVLASLTDAAWRLDYNACTVVKKLQDKCDADIVKKVEKGEVPYTEEKNRKALIQGYYCTRLQ